MSSFPERFSSHWWHRPGVRPGTGLLVWHVLFDQQPQVHAVATQYQERLAAVPGLDRVPPELLHLTLHIAATAEDTPAEGLLRMTNAVADRLKRLSPINVLLTKPYVHREGVLLIAEPTAQLAALHAEVVAGVAQAFGIGHPSNEETFIPHVSLAYANAPTPTEPAVRALRPRLGPCGFTITEVALVNQRRSDCAYRWEPLTTVSLGR